MLTEKKFDTGSLSLNYAEGAVNGPPLLVIHGITDRWQGMMGSLSRLQSRWQIFACDMRGHGKSGWAPTYRAVDYFPDIVGLLQNRIARPTVILGHSGGAIAALGAAATLPEMVRGIVLIEPPLCLRDSSLRTNLYMCTVYSVLLRQFTVREVQEQLFPDANDGKIRWFEETLACVDPEVVRVVMEDRYFEGLELAALLTQVSCPVLLFHGDVERGALVRGSDIDFFQRHLGQDGEGRPRARNGTGCAGRGRAVHIPNASHLLHLEATDRVLDLTAQWAVELDP